MSFQICCPNCGDRSVTDFRFGGEVLTRPNKNSSEQEWNSFYYFRKNHSGTHEEWWYHKFGCRKWFKAIRNTQSNVVESTYWPNTQ